MTVPEPYANRLKLLRRDMTGAGLSALLVLCPENRRYLSGFTAHDPQLNESSGCLLITARRQLLLTDSRYQLSGQSEAQGFEIVVHTSGAVDKLAEIIRKSRITRLGFEEDRVTVGLYNKLRDQLKSTEMVADDGLVEHLRISKDEGEIKSITKALLITEKALAQTVEFLQPGRSEIETARFLEDAMLDLGAEGTAFESIVASGPNAALPHARPTQRSIRESETVVIDCGAKYQGYSADITRTIVLGEPKPWIRKIYSVVREAQLNAIRGLAPGILTDDVDRLARDIIVAAGYGEQFGHSLGHGVGLAAHEAPSLSPRKSTPLAPGMIVTVEPGIYLENRGGVRLENLVLITDDGCLVLNKDRHFYDWPTCE